MKNSKLFLYCENEEGGMSDFFVQSEEDMTRLSGWMRPDLKCVENDTNLVSWMKTARIGDMHYHRLGIIIRINPDQYKEA